MAWELTGNAIGTNNFLGTTNNEPLVVKTNGTEALRIDASGRVGIGTTSPAGPLHILGPAVEPPAGLPAAQNGLLLGLQSAAGYKWIQSYGGALALNPKGNNVGIGTTNPGQKLDIEGSVIAANGPNAFEVNCDATGTHFWTNNAYNRSAPFTNWTQTLNMRDGKVGIGTASPDAKLHVSTGGNFNSPQVEITQSTPLDFARLRFKSFGIDPSPIKSFGIDPSPTPLPRPFPLWDIAAGHGVLNLFVEVTGNVMTLTSNGKVGIRTEHPDTELHVNGTATVGVLQITGGSDLAEPFLVGDEVEAEPGTVMVIDEEHPGKLKISDNAYDRKVAGIVSGAGGMKPGLMIQQDGILAGKTHVALVGRVYCKAEAISSPIEPGDPLTTSDIPGHAVKAVDQQASHGAILGKAMSPLKEGKGLVLVLVNLQ